MWVALAPLYFFVLKYLSIRGKWAAVYGMTSWCGCCLLTGDESVSIYLFLTGGIAGFGIAF